jgi:D-alanine-D-alanine ligase-like ATP-grasp enzyme
MAIFASRGRVPRMLSVLSGGAAVVLLLGAAASPSPGGAALARAPVVAGAGAATTSGGAWGQAKEVAAALNTGGGAEVNSVSCGSAGNCSAAGFYTESSSLHQQAFAVTETHGTWGKAKEVAAALNTRGGAQIESVSCASAGNCSAGGYYTGSSGVKAFVVNETNGTWGKAQEVAAALSTGGAARVLSVSCASAGNCTAGGEYAPIGADNQAFVVTETHGTWGNAQEVAAALAAGGAQIESVSCASAGNCSAAGQYVDSSSDAQAFVVTKAHGTWGNAQEVAAALNTRGEATVYSVSCASAGNCSAGGFYTGSSGEKAFVVNETNSTWGKAQEIAALSPRGYDRLFSVSCASAGNCSAAGWSGDAHAIVVTETNDTWGKAQEIAALNTGGNARLYSVSCASAGNCSAGGESSGASGFQAFVVNKANGTWGQAKEVAAALNTGVAAQVNSVSCTASGSCSAGGLYTESSPRNEQAFVVSKP